MDVIVGPQRRLNNKQRILSNCGAGEDSCEFFGQQGDQASQSLKKSTLSIHWKDQCCSWSSVLWPPLPMKSWLIGKDLDAGKDWGQEEKGVAEDELVVWHYWLNGHRTEKTQGDSEGQGSLSCCSPWSHKETDMTRPVNNCWGPLMEQDLAVWSRW